MLAAVLVAGRADWMGVNVESVFIGIELFNRPEVVYSTIEAVVSTTLDCFSVEGLCGVLEYTDVVGSHSVSEIAVPCFTTAF